MDAHRLYLTHHAFIHSVAATGDSTMPLEDFIFMGVDDALARKKPRSGVNSIAWITWHMARCEDAGVVGVVGGQSQVLFAEGWNERLGIGARDIGTGNSDEEVEGFSERVDIPTLRAYRAAVGRRSREVVAGLPEAALCDVPPAGRVERVFAEGMVGERGAWVQPFWEGRSNAWFLWLGTGHNYLHVGEAAAVRRDLGLPTR